MKRQQKVLSHTLKTGPSEEKLLQIAKEVITTYTKGKQVVVAFSGGMDSTLALLIAREVIDDIIAVHIDWGDFTYEEIRKRVKNIVRSFHIPLHIIHGEEKLKELAYRGISCNTCSRKIKLATIKEYYPDAIIITGANKSDSWGRGGIYLNPPYLAPLKDFSKDIEEKILRERYGITDFHIGVHPEREGCILRHLWMPDRDGTKVSAAAEANRTLLKILNQYNWTHYMANAKAIGNSKSIKLIVNVLPTLPDSIRKDIEKQLSHIGTTLWGDNISLLKVVINPSLDTPSGKESIGHIIKSEMMNPYVEIEFIRSKTDFIRLFQVVDAT